MLTFGSLFAGIGGFDIGLERAGMECAWQVEIDNRCNEVLRHHWPDVQRYSDVKECGRQNLKPVDLICGGFPCQDVSVAGRRDGLDGERSGLWFEFLRIVTNLKPKWVIVENVPGLLSSNERRDFAAILWGLAQCGYWWAYRILDAQYWRVAQRRRRVFVVASLGDASCVQVLFERQSSAWDSAPRREAGTGIAAPVKAGAPGRRNGGSWPVDGEFVISYKRRGGFGISESKDTTPALESGSDSHQGAIDTMPMVVARPLAFGKTTDHMDESQQTYVTAFDWQSGGDVRLNVSSEHTSALQAHQTPAVNYYGVRRLTPVECERLQGFPDGHTAINGMADTPRYKMLGNAVAVPVAEWIGRQITVQEGSL